MKIFKYKIKNKFRFITIIIATLILIFSSIFVFGDINFLNKNVSNKNVSNNENKPTDINIKVNETENEVNSPASIYNNDYSNTTNVLNTEAVASPTSNTTTSVPTTITPEIKSEKSIPILTYHAVNDTIIGIPDLFVSPSEFDKQMKYLKEQNYESITFKDFPNIDSYKKPIIITFDDGYEDNFTNAYPILKKYNHKAVIFLTTNFLESGLYLKRNQVKQMTDLISFESHTLSHKDLTKLKESDLEEEISSTKKVIFDLTGQTSIALAYPFGYYNKKVIDITKKHYEYGLTTNGGLYNPKKDINKYEIKRVYIPRSLTFEGFKNKIIRGYN